MEGQLSSRGYTSEILILGGAYCSSTNLALGVTLIVLGCIAGIVRFGVSVNSSAKKEKLYEAASKFITKIVDRPIPTVDFSSFTSSDEVH